LRFNFISPIVSNLIIGNEIQRKEKKKKKKENQTVGLYSRRDLIARNEGVFPDPLTAASTSVLIIISVSSRFHFL